MTPTTGTCDARAARAVPVDLGKISSGTFGDRDDVITADAARTLMAAGETGIYAVARAGQANSIYDPAGRARTLTAAAWGDANQTGIYTELRPLAANISEGRRIYDSEGAARTLTATAWGPGGAAGVYADGRGRTRAQAREALASGEMRARRLTPLECERVQGFPDNWTAEGTGERGEAVSMSDSARYRLVGNSVMPPVVEFLGRMME